MGCGMYKCGIKGFGKETYQKVGSIYSFWKGAQLAVSQSSIDRVMNRRGCNADVRDHDRIQMGRLYV